MAYLMDNIAETASMVRSGTGVIHLAKDHPAISVFPLLATLMEGAPRFLLDEAAINTAVEISLGRPKIILDSLSTLRIPYPTIWVEWPESGRARLRETFQGLITSDRPLPNRVGFLLNLFDGTGRCGAATWAWTSNDPNPIDRNFDQIPPNVAPISPHFDLDRQFLQSRERIEGFLKGNLAQIWHGNKVQEESLLAIWRTAEHKPNKWGEKYLRWIASVYGEADLQARLPWMYSDVYGEYIMIWAIVLMLTSSRRVVDYRPIDRSRINKIRRQRNKTPLLNHTEVTLHIGTTQAEGQRRQPLGYTRKSPRIHMVSSFLNHRGDKHWIVQPFLRGQGEVIHRNVKVKGAS